MPGTDPPLPLPSPTPLSTPEVIRRRRTARSFDPERLLPDALLSQILTLATFAPSVYNLQPWRFLLVRSPANRRKLRACAFNNPALTDAPAVVIVLGYHHPDRTHLDAMLETLSRLGATCPEAIAELRARATRDLARVKDRATWATRSALFATATLSLAAESLGIASAILETFDAKRIREAFGVPDDHAVSALVALGYTTETPPFPGRFGLDEVCHEEHFGQPWSMGNAPTPEVAD